MSYLSRRKFLSVLANAGLVTSAASVLSPSMLLAQSSGSGAGKNLVVINLLGGLDGLSAFPFFSGPQVSVLQSQVRPSLHIDPATILSVDAQTGISGKIGLHPAFGPLFSVAGGNMKLVQGYGIPGDPGRSHDTCQILMSLGATALNRPDMVGFLARLMDLQDWETLQYWALANTNAPDVNTVNRPPVLVENLDQLNYPQLWWEAENDSTQVTAVQRQLLEVRTPQSSLSQMYTEQQRVMHDIVQIVRQEIIGQQVGANSAGDYQGDWGIGARLRDAARVLKAKATSPALGHQAKDTLILMAQDGYDTHSDQANPGDTQLGLAARLGELAGNLAVFYRDLELMGALQDTVIVLYSEFGRTNYQNAQVGSPHVGSDHGHGSTALVLGGPVSAGVIGSPPTNAELQDEWYNATIPKIDYRNIFSDVLEWMNIEPGAIFDDPEYVRQSLGIFSP